MNRFWTRIVDRALTCPYLHECVTHIRMGEIREDAMSATLLELSAERERLVDELARLRQVKSIVVELSVGSERELDAAYDRFARGGVEKTPNWR